MTVDSQAARVQLAQVQAEVDRLRTLTADFRWRGEYGRGAMADRRAQKRAEAERRNASTQPDRRRQSRRKGVR